MKKKTLILSLLILMNCSSDDEGNNLMTAVVEFQDGFENANNLSDLIASDGSRWTNIQQVNPNNGMNSAIVSSDSKSEGNNSLKITALPSDDILSKLDIEKEGFSAFEGSVVTLSADFYITNTGSIENLLLMGLEYCSCWDPNVPDNQCPGVRLMFSVL